MSESGDATDRKSLARLISVKSVLEVAGALAVLAIPLFALRVIVVAKFNRDVASALAANSSPSSIVVSIALTLLPLVGLALAAGLAILAGWHGSGLGWRRFFSRGLPLLLLALLLSLPFLLIQTEWPLALSVLLIITLGFVAGRVQRELPAPGAQDPVAQAQPWRWGAMGASAVMATMFAILASPMWLPPERLVLAEVPTTVYVLSVSDGDAVLFLPGQTAVMRVPSDDLVDRQYCTSEQFESFADRIFGGPKGLPECP